VKKEQENEFFSHLDALGYQWQEESDNLAYQSFLKD
jgi:threonine dehydratase